MRHCNFCRVGTFDEGTTTVFLERGETSVVIRGVPAEVCEACGEYLLDEATTARVLAIGSSASDRGVTIELVTYAA